MGSVNGKPEGGQEIKHSEPLPEVKQSQENSINQRKNLKHQEEPEVQKQIGMQQKEPAKQKPLTSLQLMIQQKRNMQKQKLTDVEASLMPELLEAILNGTGDFHFENAVQQQGLDLQKLLFFEDESSQTLLSVTLFESQYELFMKMIQLVDFNDKDKRRLQNIGNMLTKKFISILRRPDEISKALQFMEVLSETPIIESLLQIVKSESISSHINVQNPQHLKLLGRLHKLFARFGIDTLQEFYSQAKQNQYFSIPKYPKTPIWNQLYLPIIKFNIFHQFAIKQQWELFFNHYDEHYFELSSDGYSAYMLIMRDAPFEVIEKFHQKYEIPDVNYGRINIIHCFALNKNKCLNVNFLDRFKDELFQQPYDSLTPLAIYLHRKDPQQYIVDYLKSKLNFKWDTTELNKEFNQRGQKRKQFKIPKFVKGSQFILKETDHRYPGFKLYKKRWEQYSDYYLNNVQLAKILLKYNFHVKLDIDWQGYASNIEDYYNVHLIQLLLRANQFELASQEIQKVPLNQSAIDQAFFQNILILLHCLKETDNQDIQSLLIDRILSVLKPEHLLQEIEGYYQFLRIQKETLYDCIVMVNNRILNEKLLSNPSKDRSGLIILNSKYHDNDNIFFRSICDQYALSGNFFSTKWLMLGDEGPISLYDLCSQKLPQINSYIQLFIEKGEICEKLIKIRKSNPLYVAEHQVRLFIENFPKDEEYAIQNLPNVTLNSAQLSILYQQYFNKGKFDILNHLLAYSYSKNVAFKHSIICSLSCTDNENMNYIRAARTSPALALNLEQFRSYVKLTSYNHADELLYNGFYDKLELVSGKYSDLASRDLVYRYLARQGIKNPFPKSEIKSVYCFDLPPCTRERTLIKTKQIIPQALIQEQELKEKETQQWKLQYEQNQQCTYQNRNNSSIFQSTGQQQDFLKCISIIKSEDQDVLLGQCLIFPQPIVLEKFSKFYDLLFYHYLIRNRTIDISQYMELFVANIEKLDLEDLFFKFTSKKYRTKNYAKFYVDLCILANYEQRQFACDLILKLKLDEEKYINYLNQHMQQYGVVLSEYTKKITPILSKFTYIPNPKPNWNLKQFFNLKLIDLTFEEYCITQGRLDHLEQITFTQRNLQLALVSLDIQTIIRFMDLNQEETHLEFIIKFLSENAVLTYIHKYINLNTLNLTDSKGQSLMRYVIHKKMRKVFDLFKSKQLDLVREHCQQFFHEAIQTGFYEIFEIISPTAKDLKKIKQSKLIFPNEPIQPKAKLILELFQELRLYIGSTQEGRLFDEFIRLERACVGVIHGLPTDFEFVNKQLKEIFSQTINLNSNPEKAKFQLYLMDYKVDIKSRALDIIKQARPIKQIPIEVLVESCYKATNANHHPIYDLALKLNPVFLIQLANQSFIINNLYYGLQIALNKEYNQLLKLNIQNNDKDCEINKFGLQILKSIVDDNFEMQFQIDHLNTLSKVVSQLESKLQGQITPNFRKFLKITFQIEVEDN